MSKKWEAVQKRFPGGFYLGVVAGGMIFST